MYKLIFSFAIFLHVATLCKAQNVGIGTTTPDASAILEIKSTTKGFLPPRMTALQKTGISAPKAGLLIYQTDATQGLYVFNGSAWVTAINQPGYMDLLTNQTADGTKTFVEQVSASLVTVGTGKQGFINNTAVGDGVLASNITGYANTGIGNIALSLNTTGTQNVAVGRKSLYFNTKGSANTALGLEALAANTDGTNNTAIGFQSLAKNYTGYNNTAFGTSSLGQNLTGYNNTASGLNSLLVNSSGANNSAGGKQSLYNNNLGNGNTGYGLKTLYNSATGNNNTGAGIQALFANASGSFNTALGYFAGVESNNFISATAIGAYSSTNCNNCIVLGSANGYNSATATTKIGIGTINPYESFQVSPNGHGGILLGTDKYAGGYTTLEMGISAQSNGYSYIQSTRLSGSNYGDLLLNPGTSAVYTGYNGEDAGFVGVNHSTAATIQYPLDINQLSENRGLRLCNDLSGYNQNWDIFAATNGNLQFAHNGIVKAWISPVDGSYNQISDARFKRNIKSLGNVLDKVNVLYPKTYRYKANKITDPVSTGFIAQEVLPLFPELVGDFKYVDKDTTNNTILHAIDYNGFSVIAIKAIQEQQKEIENLIYQHSTLIKFDYSEALKNQQIKLKDQRIAISKLIQRIEALERK